MKNNSGVTLIELLVTMAAIGLVATIVLVSLNNARESARIVKAQTDLHQTALAIEFLYDDTGLHPVHCPLSPCMTCPGGPERILDSCAAGLECTDGGFPGWNGPYMARVPQDPWGNSYVFDADYRCLTVTQGCEGIPNGVMVRAIHSRGPNGSPINNYDSDNIVLVLCR